MTKTILRFALGSLVVALATSAEAQQAAKIFKIGSISSGSASRPDGGFEALRRELRGLGYIEGKNIMFESRYYEGKLDLLPTLVDELVRLKVDLILTSTTPGTRAAKSATRTIPIVFITQGDPVVSGLVDNLARPGGNLTGFTRITPLLAGKRLELLKETVPKLSRIAVMWTRQQSDQSWEESEVAAKQLDLYVHSMEVGSADQIENAFKEAINAGSVALAVTPNPFTNANRTRIAELAIKNRLPTIYPDPRGVNAGGLMSYGADQSEPHKRVASMVDKIFKGAKPADIPVEQPKKFEFIINLKAAKQIGLTIPPNVLARADKVIRF